MDVNVSLGTYCPKCNLTIGTHIGIGANNTCPNCDGEMIVAPKEQKVRVISNFTCTNCGCKVGHMSVIGDDAKCPSCGKKI